MKNGIFFLFILLIAIALVSLAILLPQTPEEPKIKKFGSYYELQKFVGEKAIGLGGIYDSQLLVARAETPGIDNGVVKELTGALDYSTTNIQVEGVDEADIVKNDGKYIYVVSGDNITIINAYPAQDARIVSTINLNGNPTQIFVNNDKLVVFGNQYSYYPYVLYGTAVKEAETMADSSKIAMPYRYYPPKTFVYVYDISNKESPVLSRNITVDGNYIDSRMIEDYIYVIFNSPINVNAENVTLPVITSNGVDKNVDASEIYYFDNRDYAYTYTTILSLNTENDQQDYNSKTILMGYSQNIFVSLNNIFVTYSKYVDYFDYADKIVDEALIPNLPLDVVVKINSVRSGEQDKYERFQKIGNVVEDYLQGLNNDERSRLEEIIESGFQEIELEIQKEIEQTVIHKISINDGNIEYKASGHVPGQVLNQFSMDEYDGYFRIVTTTSRFGGIGPVTISRSEVGKDVEDDVGIEQETKRLDDSNVGQAVEPSKPVARDTVISSPAPPQPTSLNHVYVLDSDLKIVGKVEDLAPGESIYSVRFMGKRAYLVTFRRVDPLFVVDLSNPTNPEVLGQLKIPGFSDYLHPYDENHIIGVGKEVTEAERPMIQGVKLGLFDVSDPANPKEVAKYEIGDSGTDSEALRDHKAFLFSKDRNLLVIPILLNEKVLPEPFGRYVWQGAYVFDLTAENGFTLEGRVTHVPENYTDQYYYFSPYTVKRSLYIGDVLWTVSNKILKANALNDLDEINKVELPGENLIPVTLGK